ncbi:MAG TPA: hypothetical protein VHN14_24170 [Kofleriaceae bacterium]|jgi:hypothetical protein|nr:hypothetical protein [Kofleriaceae bacterium]
MKCALVLVIAACSRRDPIASCDDDLRGVYVAGDERWMVLDNGPTLEAYPLFSDGHGPDQGGALPAGVVAAPRVIDFERAATGPTERAAGPYDAGPKPGQALEPFASSTADPPPGPDPKLSAKLTTLAGTLRRRYMQRQARCEAHVPVHITRCAGDTLELVLADPSPPLAYVPCTWSRTEPSRLVRWRRE